MLAAVTTDPDSVREQVARDVAAVGEMPAYRAVLAVARDVRSRPTVPLTS